MPKSSKGWTPAPKNCPFLGLGTLFCITEEIGTSSCCNWLTLNNTKSFPVCVLSPYTLWKAVLGCICYCAVLLLIIFLINHILITYSVKRFFPRRLRSLEQHIAHRWKITVHCRIRTLTTEPRTFLLIVKHLSRQVPFGGAWHFEKYEKELDEKVDKT